MSTYYGGGYPPAAPPPPTGQASFSWIGESWRLFSASAGTWVLGTLAAAAAPLIGYFVAVIAMVTAAVGHAAVSGGASSAPPTLPIGFIIGLYAAMFLYFPYITAGYLRMAVKQIRGEPLNVMDVFSGGPAALRMIGFVVVVGIIGIALEVVLAYACGVSHYILSSMTFSTAAASAMPPIPSLIAYECLLFAVFGLLTPFIIPGYVLIADNWSISDALKSSIAAVSANWLRCVGLNFAFGAIYFVSVIPCGLGVFVTAPMAALIMALSYRDMIGMPGLVQPGTYYTGNAVDDQPAWPPPPDRAADSPQNLGSGGWTPPPGA